MQKKSLVLLALTLCLAASIYYFKSSTDTITDKLSQIHEMAKKDRPDLAAEQEFEMTKDPSLGYPPVQRKITAFKEAQKLLVNKNKAKAIDNVAWEERGPNNVGGRTRALIWDPNDPAGKKVFSGTVAGGLWYNNDITDLESEWQNIDDFMANLAISTLAYEPNNTQIFYAGTGLGFTGRLRGAGIWKSTDGGSTWNQLSSTTNDEFYFTQKIVISETSRIFAATAALGSQGSNPGLKYSDDGGASWTDVIASTDMADVEIEDDGVNGETIYASDFDGGIYKSIDDGDTWTDVSPGDAGDRVELAVAPTDVNTVYAVAASGTSVGWFKKSTDGGTNWTDITIPSYLEQGSCEAGSNDFTRGQAWFDLILAIYPNDPNSVIAGGIDLHRTTDGGANWESLSYWTGQCDDYVHADQHAILFKDGSDSEAVFGNDGGVFYSNELDQSNPNFEETILGYNTALFYATAAANVAGSNVYLAGAQDNGTSLFQTAGINSSIEVTGGDGAYCFIDQDNSNLMITSYVYNNYYITTDAWNSFSSTESDNSGNFINQADYDDETDQLYATRNANEIAVYSNISSGSASKSIKSVSIGGRQTSNLKVSPYTDNRVIVGTEGGEVYVIDNANATPTVTNIDNNDLPNGNVSSIDIGDSDDHLLVTYSNYGVTSVWETTDGGDTWNNKEGNLPDMPIRWGLYNPNNRSEVLLATEVGVWSTDDITTTTPEWEPTSDRLANVRCDMLQYRESDQQVVVATFGRGLYTSYAFLEGAVASFEADAKITYVGKTVTFDNKSVGDASSYEWNFGDGTTSSDEDVSHAYATPGTYTVSLEVNGGEDLRSDIIIVLANRDGNYSLTDGGDFDEYTDDFYADNIAGTPFELGSSSIDQKDGTVSGTNAWVTGLDDEEYVNNSTAYLYTPHFDLSTAGTYTLSFDTKYSFEPEWEGFIVEYTLDSGSNWTTLNPVIETGWYNETTVSNSIAFQGNSAIFGDNTGGEFETKSTDLSSLSGNGNVGLRFVFRTDPGTTDVGMALDDFTISGPSKDATPDFSVSDQSLSTCAETEVTFHDLSEGDIVSWSWDFGNGATPATATGRGPHVVSYSSTGTADVSLTVEGETNGTQSETKLAYINILTNPVVEKTVIASDESLCYGGSITITIENADSDFSYQIFDADTDEALNTPITGDGSNIEVSTPELFASATYYVLVDQKSSNCSKVLDSQVTITIDPPVLSNTVISEDDICAGEAISASIDLAQSGVNYYFVNTSTMDVLGDQIEGQDDELTITSGALTEAIDVMVMATSIDTSCELELTDETSINVRELPDATITDDGAILSAPIGGIVYQWVLDGDTLETETSRSITVNSFGEYQVIVTANGCTSISDVFSPVVLGVEELIESGELSFYPNPTRGAVNLNQKGLFNYLKIYNNTGRVVESRNILNNEIISLHNFNDGIYLFELTGPNKQATFRINKVD